MENEARAAAGDPPGAATAPGDLGARAREVVVRLAEELELERRMQETPLTMLGVAAAAGLVLGGGLWPLLRPFARAAARAALSPTNLLAIAAALGAMEAAGMRAASPRPGDDGEPTR